MRRLTVREERWPLREPFVISRMRQDEAEVVVVEIEADGCRGRGEADACLDGPDAAPVALTVEAVREAVEAGAGRAALCRMMPAGPARNALDCALWDLEAKQAGRPVWALAGLTAPGPVTTVLTIGLGTPEAMARTAAAEAGRAVLKLKLGRAEGDLDRVAAVRRAAPEARLIVDANTGWGPQLLAEILPGLAALGVALVEQPLAPGADAALLEITGQDRPIPIAADESVTDLASLPALIGRYECVNVKLDKTGGLTEGLALVAAARKAGMGVMIGCNLGTSLAMAPGVLLAQGAEVVDLDGPLLLARDRQPGLVYQASEVLPPDAVLWG
ncbi:MAG: N-acetyl-D-Glu racemase DgcA [Pseudomonadota bacterium]